MNKNQAWTYTSPHIKIVKDMFGGESIKEFNQYWDLQVSLINFYSKMFYDKQVATKEIAQVLSCSIFMVYHLNNSILSHSLTSYNFLKPVTFAKLVLIRKYFTDN